MAHASRGDHRRHQPPSRRPGYCVAAIRAARAARPRRPPRPRAARRRVAAMEKSAGQLAKSLARGARSKYAKAKRTYTCRTLKELIKAYRACTTAAEERALVKKESAHIRDLFKEGDTAFRRRNIAKLLFFHMNGYPTNFGMTECVKLCATDKFSDKRVAYLGLMILVDETEDILMLITNSLKRDLASPDQHIVGVALTVLADLASPDMARDLLPEIEKHLDSVNAYVRKKAALASVRAARKLSAEETPNVLAAVPRLFETRQSASHISGTALVLALARQSSDNVPALRASTVPVMLTVLRDLLLTTSKTKTPQANVISGVRNPFLQVKVLQAVRTVARGASREAIEPISDVLAQVAANTDSSKTVGTAVLYECVRVIIALNTESSLRTLAVSVLARFLSHKDPNVRYIGLQELVKVVNSDQPDATIEKHRKTISDCLNEPDPSIRHRALELLHAIATAETAPAIAGEMIEFMTLVEDDDSLRESAARKVCNLTERFSPSAEWRCTTFMRALKEVDTSMPEPLVASFLAWVSADPSSHAHAAKESYMNCLLLTGSDRQSGGAASISTVQASTALATVVDPFESVVAAAPPPAPSDAPQPPAPAKSAGSDKRKVRYQRVAVQLFGEYGDYIIDASGGGIGGVSPDDAITAVERVLSISGVDVTSFSSTSLPCDVREDEFAYEVGLVREAAMSALVKLAARLTYMASNDARMGGGGISLGASVAAAAAKQVGSGGPLSLEGPQGLLALEDGSADSKPAPQSVEAQSVHASPTTTVGLGTDMLASLGIGESPPRQASAESGNGALVPSAPPGGGEMSILQARSGDDLLLGEDDVGVHPLLLRVRRILAVHQQSMDLEAQQRACEYSILLRGDMTSLRALALSRMPPMDYAAYQERMARSSQTEFSNDEASGSRAPFSEDLLSLLDDDVGSSPAVSRALPSTEGQGGLLALPSIENAPPASGAQALDDLLNGSEQGTVAQAKGSSNVLQTAVPTGDSAGAIPMISTAGPPTDDSFTTKPSLSADGDLEATSAGSATICESALLTVSAVFYKPSSDDPRVTRAELLFENNGDAPFSSFVFQLAVPKYIQTEMKPASSPSVPAKGTASQVVMLTNTLHGTKPVQLRYRIQFELLGNAVLEEGTVGAADLPSGL